jgi:hypothetical protein
VGKAVEHQETLAIDDANEIFVPIVFNTAVFYIATTLQLIFFDSGIGACTNNCALELSSWQRLAQPSPCASFRLAYAMG